MGYFADRLQSVIERCEDAVGSRLIGFAQKKMDVPDMSYNDSVQLLLTAVGRRKDRENAVRLAMYREAISCITIALPPPCLQPHAFVGELVLHSDEELALMASRVVQRLTHEQPARRRDLLACFVKMLLRLLSEPTNLNGVSHKEELEALECRLLTVVDHILGLLDTWSQFQHRESSLLEPFEQERAGSQVVRLETELVRCGII